MEVKIQSIHFDATEKLQAFVVKKMAQVENTYKQPHLTEVQLKVVKPATALNKQACVTVGVTGKDLYVEKTCDTFEESIDQCVESLKVQLTKFKEKQRSH